MNWNRLKRILLWIPLLTALGVSLALLVLTALFALAAPHNGIPASEPPLGNMLGVARGYLFRNALKNTLIVLAAVGILVFVLARTVAPHLHLEGRRCQWLCALSLTPLFLPIPFAAFLWRPLFTQIDLVNQPNLALLAVALVQVWRLWPLAILAAPFVGVAGPRRTAAAVMLAALWLALIDTGTLLISTGGQPFNRTHLWATWAFHTLWVSRLWGYGAVMVGGLAATAGIIGWLIWRTLTRTTGHIAPSHLPAAPVANTTILIVGAGVALLPFALTLPRTFAYPIDVLLLGLAQAGYWRWTINTLLVFVLATLVAALIVLPALTVKAGQRPRLLAISFIAGLAVVPVWYWIAARWPMAGSGGKGFLWLAVAAGLSAGLVALWPDSAVMEAVHPGRKSRSAAKAALVLVTALTVVNQFALGVVLAGSRTSHTVGTGAALRLAGDAAATPVLEMASMTTFALAFAAAFVFTKWVRRLDVVATQPPSRNQLSR